jgi:hypothetical protein
MLFLFIVVFFDMTNLNLFVEHLVEMEFGFIVVFDIIEHLSWLEHLFIWYLW